MFYVVLLGLLEDIYAAVDSCETAQEIWLRVQQMMKGFDIGIQEKKDKLFNEWERYKHFPEKISSNLKFLNNLQPEWSRHVTIVHQTKDLHTADYTQLYDFLKYNQKEVDELRTKRLAKTHDPLALIANSNNPFNYPMFHQDQPSSSTYMQQPLPNNNNYNPQPSFNQNYMQQPMPNPEDITDPTTAMNMRLILMAKTFKLNYSTPTNNNQRISSNPHNRQYARQNVGNQNGFNAVQNVENQVVQNAFQNPGVQNVGNHNGLIVVPGIANQNPNGNGNVVAAQAKGNAIRNNVDLDEIKEVNANCILMANLQQASTSGTQTDKAPDDTFKTTIVSKSISILNEEFSDDTSPSVARKFLNEAKSTIVTLQCVVKQKMTLDIHNWSSTAHLEIHKIVKDEIFLIVNQVDARLQNFKIQFLKEATKFVRDFKSLTKEADESLAKHKALEFEIERLFEQLSVSILCLLCKVILL
ncbi:hypothetical protein Tco_0559708 [Tanacetum coccineum]